MERKLAHIEKIEWIKPIEGADKIELCGVLGWQCVVAKKDEFRVDQKIVYIEIDSIVPELYEFEFLRDRKFRVRTIKLRGEVSQGLVVPLSILGKNRPVRLAVGDDVTDLLGITKYLTPSEQSDLQKEQEIIKLEKNRLKKYMMKYAWYRKLFLSKKQKSKFPYWVSKTDEERIQNMPQVLTDFSDKYIYITEKVDGQSASFTGKMIPRFSGFLGKILPKKFVFVVCSRNLTVGKDSVYWKTAENNDLYNILKESPTLTIQGEQCGPKIQGNKYNLTRNELFIFNIIDHEKNYWYSMEEIKAFCDINNLNTVPLLASGYRLEYFHSVVNNVVEWSKGKSQLYNIPREGIVVRCIEKGKKVLSFKCINPDFLLKFD